MATRRYGVSELVSVFADLAKPVADDWRAERSPGWWATAKGWPGNSGQPPTG